MQYREVLFKKYTSTAHAPMMAISEESYQVRQPGFRKKFNNLLPQDKSTPILDIGCGMGYFLWFLQRNGFTNTAGIDFSPEQIEVAKKYGVNNVYVSHWKEYLSDKHSKFGFIMLDNVIEHLTKDEIVELLQVILSSLQPGGKLYISTPNSGSVFGLPLAFIDFTHEVFFTAASLSQVLNACGFNPVQVSGEPLVAFDIRTLIRKSAFSIIKPFVKFAYILGTGGGGRTSIPHVIEPSLAAIAQKPLTS